VFSLEDRKTNIGLSKLLHG
jgi:hypothetical protein